MDFNSFKPSMDNEDHFTKSPIIIGSVDLCLYILNMYGFMCILVCYNNACTYTKTSNFYKYKDIYNLNFKFYEHFKQAGLKCHIFVIFCYHYF